MFDNSMSQTFAMVSVEVILKMSPTGNKALSVTSEKIRVSSTKLPFSATWITLIGSLVKAMSEFGTEL